MTKKKKYLQILILLVILVLPSLLYLVSTAGKHNFVHLPFYGKRISDTIYYKIPALNFEDINKFEITNNILKNKIIIFSSICFNCSNSSYRILELLSSIQNSVKKKNDILLITFVTNIEKNIEKKVKRIQKKLNFTENWYFINSSKTKVYDFLINGLLLGTESKINYHNNILLNNDIILVDHNKHIRGYFNGLEYKQAKELKDAIQQLRYLKNILEPNKKQ